MSVKVSFSKEQMLYSGKELRPHFLLSKFAMKGTSVLAFCGPCGVKTEHLVDWEDRLENDYIEARLMVHFLGEFFGASLREAVVMQRLFMSIAAEQINLVLEDTNKRSFIRRIGDDLFVGDKKLSVSIVTASPVSQLLHVGINIDPLGAPVAAIGLEEMGLGSQIEIVVERILDSFKKEYDSIEWACVKVRPVI
ncbi:MAG: hypothetical protein A3K03_01415 [Bdellovibrionales bacterium RIFOXYD1_FULL_44_7]|nr:MAG: hypothetical protein A3K03_01415 [Bdellovibrionales bacterium RIFOXYD1_FULL_44_7]